MWAITAGCSRKSDIGATLASADRHFEKREFEAAKIQYFNALQTQPTNSHARMKLGCIFFEQGQLQHAFPLLRQVRDIYPNEIPVREALALIYSISGTNLWKEEVDAILQREPANETAVMTLLRTANTPEAIARFTNTLQQLRTQAGDRAVFRLADGELAIRRGDKAGGIAAFQQAIQVEPTSVLAHMTLGGVLYSDGNKDEALVLLAKAAELSPPYGPARLRLAQALLQSGKVEEGIRALDELNAKAPEVIPAWTTRAEVAFNQKDYPNARRLLERALSQSPSDPVSLRVRAKIDLAENKPADAIQALESASKWMPASSEIQYQLGIANLINKDSAKALVHLRQAVRLDGKSIESAMLLAELEIARGNSAEAIGLLVDLTQRAPHLPQPKMLLARAYRATGRLDDAISAYSALRRQFPTNTAAAVQLGMVLRQKNRDKEARSAFEDCLALDRKNPMAVEQLIQLDVKAGDRNAAMARIEQRIKESPGETILWLIKSELLRTAGDSSGAEAALRKVLEIAPDSQQALLGLAQLFIRSGRNAEALAELERAVQKAPSNVGALTLIGMIHTETGKYAKARASYETALKIQPNSALVLNNLSFLLSEKMGELSLAHEMATRARRDNPQSAIVAETLGWIEYRRKNFPEALRLLIDASDELGGNPEVQYHLGMAHYMMGHEAPARIALHQAVDSPANFEEKEVAKTHLAILETPTEPPSPETIAALVKRRAEAPQDLIALSRLANSYAASRATEKSREAFEAALKINPSSPNLLSRFGLLQIEQLGATNRALELARQARQLAPEDPVVGHVSGRTASLAGDHSYAFSLLQNSASQLPTNPVVQYDFAIAAFAMGRIDLATNTMIAVATMNSSSLASRAKSFVELVSFALKPSASSFSSEVQKSLAAEPESLVSLFASARWAESKQQAIEAQRIYEKILARSPGFIPAARQLALLLAEVPGNESRAYDLTLKIRQDLPRDDEIAASLGKLACRRGDYRFSIQLLTEATRTRSRDGDALFYLGVAHLGLKQTADGKTALEKALAATPDGKFTDEAKKLLSSLAVTNK